MSRSIWESHIPQIDASADQSQSSVIDLASQWYVEISDFLSKREKLRDVLITYLDTIGAFFRKFSLSDVLYESPKILVPTTTRISVHKNAASTLFINYQTFL